MTTSIDPAGIEQAPTHGMTLTIRAMRDELAEHYKGANPPSIDKAVAAVRPGSAMPDSWRSRGMAADAVKAYRADIGVVGAPVAAKKPAVRTARPKPTRTAVRPPDPEPVRTVPESTPVPSPPPVVQPDPVPQPTETVRTAPAKRGTAWPVLIIALPAMVAIWSGWVGLGGLTGFGVVHPLPGIADAFSLNTAITLPIGVEAYAAYAMRKWLSGQVPPRAKQFAKWSAIGSLVVGALGQVAYHVLVAFGVTAAPWWITTLVACLPVAVVGMAAALHHLCNQEG